MDQVYAGMTVADSTGPIGMVESVEDDPVTGNPRIVVRRDDGDLRMLSPGMYMVVGDVLHIDEAEEQEVGMATDTTGVAQRHSGIPANRFDPQRTQELPIASGTAGYADGELAPGEEVRIPVIREEAVVRIRKVERGGVRVHKTVNEREEVIEQPTLHETVDVERIPIGRVVEAAPEVREEGDTLIIPVLEEMLVVEKRLVLKEEIRVTRRRTTETEQVRVVLNEEQVTIERIDERAAGQ